MDNPHVEASFKSLKYCAAFPGRFRSIEHARLFCQGLSTWYNRLQIGHHHPLDVHYGPDQSDRFRASLCCHSCHAWASAAIPSGNSALPMPNRRCCPACWNITSGASSTP